MRKQLCVAAAACLLPAAALAADLPARPAYHAPVMAPAPIATWTACYVGGHAGYGWSRWRDRDMPGAATLVGIPGTGAEPGDQVVFGYSGRYSTSGFVGGGQFGCDRQFGNFVLGAVVDFSWADQKKDSALFDIIPGPNFSNDEQATVRMRYFGTARARAGFLAMPTVLLYGTGGFAWARTEMTVRGQAFTGPNGFEQFIDPGTYPFSVSGKANHVGWTLGAGVDWMFAPGWTLGLEYLHIDLGNAHYRFGNLASLPNRTTREILGRGTNVSLSSDVVRATLNYRF